MHGLRVYPRISAAPARGEAAGPKELSDNPIKVSSARQRCLSACFLSSLVGQAPAALPGGVFGAGCSPGAPGRDFARWRRRRRPGGGQWAEERWSREKGFVPLSRTERSPQELRSAKGAHEGRRGEGSGRRWCAASGAGSAPGRDGLAEHHGQPTMPPPACSALP